MPFRLNAHVGVGDGEVGVDLLRHGDVLYGVALLFRGGGIERILQFHIRVERVVFGTGLLLGDTVVDGNGDFRLVGEELSELQARRDLKVRLAVLGAGADTILQSAEAFRDVLALHVDRSHVGQLHIEVAVSCPAAGTVVFLQSQFIDPHLPAFLFSGEVAYADDHRFDLAQRRITHHRHFIVRMVGIVRLVRPCEGRRAKGACPVTLPLHIGEEGERDVEHVVFRPYLLDIGDIVPAVFVAWCRELKRDLIFIVVALVVGAETDEDGELIVLQVRGVRLLGVGMDEHLDALVLAYVERRVLIHTLCLTR